jgi:hypothetical protein
MYRASGALFNTIDTVAEENPLLFATSRIVTTEDRARFRDASEPRRDFAAAAFRVGFESECSIVRLNFGLLLADTTGR